MSAIQYIQYTRIAARSLLRVGPGGACPGLLYINKCCIPVIEDISVTLFEHVTYPANLPITSEKLIQENIIYYKYQFR